MSVSQQHPTITYSALNLPIDFPSILSQGENFSRSWLRMSRFYRRRKVNTFIVSRDTASRYCFQRVCLRDCIC